MEKITLCGDNCLECPRYLARSDSELEKVAELWFRVGETKLFRLMKLSVVGAHLISSVHIILWNVQKKIMLKNAINVRNSRASK